MADPDAIFMEGWRKHLPEFDFTGPSLAIPSSLLIQSGAWNETSTMNEIRFYQSYGPLPGASISFHPGTNSEGYLKTYRPGTFARSLGGVRHAMTENYYTDRGAGVTFWDGGTPQFTLRVNSVGKIEAIRGDLSGTILATSDETTTAGVGHMIEWDITFDPSLGKCKVWLDRKETTIDLTSINTAPSGNSYYNQFSLGYWEVSFETLVCRFQDIYLWDYIAAGGSELPALNDPVIETQFPIAAGSASDFSPALTMLGEAQCSTSVLVPDAGDIILRKVVCPASGDLEALYVNPDDTTAYSLKPVIYADDGASGVGSLLGEGPEITGTTAGVDLRMPLAAPVSVVAGTPYWIGVHLNQSIQLHLDYASGGQSGYNEDLCRQFGGNSYGGGVPAGPLGSGSPEYCFACWGEISGATTNFTQVDDPGPPEFNYNESNVVGAEDLFTFSDLNENAATVMSVAVYGIVGKEGAGGARDLSLRTKTGVTTDNGSDGEFPLTSSRQMLRSYWFNDPDTGVPFTVAGLNAAEHGYKVDA